MKRAREGITETDISSESPPTKQQNAEGTSRGTTCELCCLDLDERCGECQRSGQDRACQGFASNAVCGHPFHIECVTKWRSHPLCLLCNVPWISPRGLSLKQLAAAKLADNESVLLGLIQKDLEPSVYATLDTGLRVTGDRQIHQIPAQQKRLLAHLFAQYLDVEEIKILLACKGEIDIFDPVFQNCF
jgi:hypothetical protein